MPTSKYGGLMMFSGCFSSRATEQLNLIRGIIKSNDYIKILEENLQLSMQNLHLSRGFTFLQDNDPKHTFKSVTAWLKKKQKYCSAMTLNKS